MTTKQYLAAFAIFIVLIGFHSSREDHAIEPRRPGGAVVAVLPIRASYQLLFLK